VCGPEQQGQVTVDGGTRLSVDLAAMSVTGLLFPVRRLPYGPITDDEFDLALLFCDSPTFSKTVIRPRTNCNRLSTSVTGNGGFK
jgi:hypothetical protein